MTHRPGRKGAIIRCLGGCGRLAWSSVYAGRCIACHGKAYYRGIPDAEFFVEPPKRKREWPKKVRKADQQFYSTANLLPEIASEFPNFAMELVSKLRYVRVRAA
jgi:hypothetical protein